LGRGCRENVVSASAFDDLGAGGIKIGEPSHMVVQGSGPAQRPVGFKRPEEEARGNVITDNVLRDGAKSYYGGPAVWIGQCGGNTVSHNEVTGTWYFGISVGWNWGYGPNWTRDNIVERNHVHHIGNRLGSHSSIYTLGIQPGTVVRNNLVHHSPGYGIALDQASTGVLVENNVVHHQHAGGLHFNMQCLGNIVQNNVFALNGTAGQWTRYGDPPLTEDTNCNVLMQNVVYFRDARLFNESKWQNYRMVIDYNVYYDASGKPVRPLGFSWDEWRTKGQGSDYHLDGSSVVADPLFVDPEHDDFRLKPESPALRLGFRPIDLTDVGPRRKRDER
jgi:hypothetical protein